MGSKVEHNQKSSQEDQTETVSLLTATDSNKKSVRAAQFFPEWFETLAIKSENSDSGQQRSEIPADQRNIPETLRWEDLDGSEHPYGKLPSEWAESERSKGNRILWGRAKKYQPVDKEENTAYTNFMLNIVDGLDENLTQLIYWRADHFKNIIPGRDDDSNLKSIMNNSNL